MDLIVIDFETYYDKEYSLSKLSTEEYIRDERFETIGVAVKKNNEPTQWLSGEDCEIRGFLDSFNLNNSFVVGHNMRFDAAILAWRYGICPAGLGDTMGMGQILHGLTSSVALKSLSDLYGIGEKGTEVENALGKRRQDFNVHALARYGDYCMNDVDLTHSLFRYMVSKMTKQELKLIDITIRMFTEPVLELNKAVLLEHLHKTRKIKEELLNGSGVDKDQLMSNVKFAEALRSLNVEPPTKISPATGKETFAFSKTDEGFQALTEHEDPRVQALVAGRLGNKSTIEETRTENFIGIANRGLLAVPLKYCGAVKSHRWSGVDHVNLQNIPRKSPLRKAIQAPKGYKIVAADLSNIELRLAYWFAGAESKVQLVRDGVDLYKSTASEITRIPYEEVSDDIRYLFKVVNLSGIYGVGAITMAKTLKLGGVAKDLNEVKAIVGAFRETNPELVAAWRTAGEMLRAVYERQAFSMGNNNVITAHLAADNISPLLGTSGMMKPNGMVLGLPNLRKLTTATGESWAFDAKVGRAVIPEYTHPAKTFQRCIQSLARDIIAEHLVLTASKYKVALTVHDELVIVCKDDEVDECVKYTQKVMTTPPAWCPDLPLACEIGVGDNYMDAK